MKLAIFGLVAGVLLAQTLSFAVASIKPSNPNEVGSNTDSDPGRITMQNVTLKRCIQRAYGVPDIQISGGPKWLDKNRYDIEAYAGYPAGYDEVNEMLQRLLRLKLRERHHVIEGGAFSPRSPPRDALAGGLCNRRREERLEDETLRARNAWPHER